MASLNRLSILFRSRARATAAELAAYGEALEPLLDRLGALYARWRQDIETISREDELANGASIQRWEAAGLLDRLRSVQPPPRLSRLHAGLESVITDTARASQLLSNGYRFHSSRARCDGQALMLVSEERFAALCQALAQQGVNASADAPPAAVLPPSADDAGAPAGG